MRRKDGQKSEDLQRKIDELQNQLKRALADYQNLEKRTHEERHEQVRSANRYLLLRLLPVLDTLLLAGRHVEDEGLKLSIKQFQDVLKQEGVERIETENKHFDPKIMEAVEVEKGDEGKVLSEIRAGYILNGEVLRVAQVKVGKQKIDSKEEEKVKEELQRGDYM